MNIEDWMIPDEFDDDDLPALIESRLRGEAYVSSLARFTQAQGRLMRTRPTQNPSVEIVELRGRSEMENVTEDLRAALVKFADVQSLLGRWQGKQPPRGSVLRWTKRFEVGSGELRLKQKVGFGEDVVFEAASPSEYVYVAFRATDGWWYVTGAQGRDRFEWDALVRKIGDAECQLVSSWTDVPVPEKPREESMDPEAWARLMFGPKDVKPAE
jgi:hypothetical protein